MNRKQKNIVSVVGIAIVLLSLLGLTYAYYLTRIQGNTNTKSISVTTADLKLEYSDNKDVITGTNMSKFADNTDIYVGALTVDEVLYAGLTTSYLSYIEEM